MPTSVSNAPGGNNGQTDKDRGQTAAFTYDKGMRNTGKTGSVTMVPNPNTVDGNKSTVKDPRTTPSK